MAVDALLGWILGVSSMTAPDKYLNFLKDCAAGLPHSGRSLLDHLVGTHDLLQQWGNPEPVCLAGLFHSIYGTQIYKHQAVSILARNLVAHLIGDEAEKLAYIFCVQPRPKAFLDAAASDLNEWGFFDSNTDTTTTFSRDELDKLLEIETANLIEQGGNRHWLCQLSKTNISRPAIAAIVQWLEEKG